MKKQFDVNAFNLFKSRGRFSWQEKIDHAHWKCNYVKKCAQLLTGGSVTHKKPQSMRFEHKSPSATAWGSSDAKAWLWTLADLQKLMKDESRQTFSLHLHNFSFVFNLQLDLRLFITFLLSINQKLPINQRESWKPRWTSRTWEKFKECMLIVHWESDKKIVSFIKLIVKRRTKCSWIFFPSEPLAHNFSSFDREKEN